MGIWKDLGGLVRRRFNGNIIVLFFCYLALICLDRAVDVLMGERSWESVLQAESNSLFPVLFIAGLIAANTALVIQVATALRAQGINPGIENTTSFDEYIHSDPLLSRIDRLEAALKAHGIDPDNPAAPESSES
jgi:hypothetical protein